MRTNINIHHSPDINDGPGAKSAERHNDTTGSCKGTVTHTPQHVKCHTYKNIIKAWSSSPEKVITMKANIFSKWLKKSISLPLAS